MAARISKSLERQLRDKGLLPAKIKSKRGMNKLEEEYAAHLEQEKVYGCGGDAVDWFAFEPIRLRLAGDTFYKPDFAVLFTDGTLEFHETKGFMREAARVRLRVAAELYPWRFVIVRKVKGGWEFEDVPGRRA